jgi:multidrug efflux system membrane fusion protein
LLGGGFGCRGGDAADTKSGGGKNRDGGAGEKVPVVVEKVQKKSVPLTLDAIGAVESMRTVAIKSIVTGSLWKVGFQEGSEVKKGDLLFEIDPRPFRIALSVAEADLQKTQAQLDRAEADLKRNDTLLARGLVSTSDYQTVENSARTLRAQLLSNKATVENAKLQLEYCAIRAPCDGRTGALTLHEGDLVRGSDASVFLVTITQLSPIYVTFAVPQHNLSNLQRYIAAGKVTVEARVSGGAVEKGELSFMDSAVDPATGTVKLKAMFANEDHALWPAQFIPVRATLAIIPDQIVVPSTAVQNGQRGLQAFIIRPDNTAELRNVTIARTWENDTVVASGLKEGETVVVDGQIRLRKDSLVEFKPPVVDVPTVRASRKKASASMPEAPEGEKSKHPPG